MAHLLLSLLLLARQPLLFHSASVGKQLTYQSPVRSRPQWAVAPNPLSVSIRPAHGCSKRGRTIGRSVPRERSNSPFIEDGSRETPGCGLPQPHVDPLDRSSVGRSADWGAIEPRDDGDQRPASRLNIPRAPL